MNFFSQIDAEPRNSTFTIIFTSSLFFNLLKRIAKQNEITSAWSITSLKMDEWK